jgi:mannan endo-1,4-beta-mannosidase
MLRFSLRLFFQTTLLLTVNFIHGQDLPAGVPSNPKASSSARKVLQYLNELPNQPDRRLLIGQNLGHGDELNSDREERTFFKFTEKRIYGELYKQTGKYPAITSIDYEYNYPRPIEQLLHANEALKTHWKKGALITINWSSVNPWSGGWPGDKTNQGKLEELHLSAPSSDAKQKFWDGVDRTAAALQDLRDAGVVVMWRPLQEMDGNWFWHGNDMEDFKKLWIDMFNTLTQKHELNNLLWVYSPTWLGGVNSYAGDAYVDIIAPTVYSNEWGYGALANWSLDDRYRDMLSHNKPIALGEAGPPAGNHEGATGFDNRTYLQEIIQNAPRVCYLVAWNDWYEGDGKEEGNLGHYSSLPFNKYSKELLEHPWAVDRSEVDWNHERGFNCVVNGSFELDAKVTPKPSGWNVWMQKYAHRSTSFTAKESTSGNRVLAHFAKIPYEVMTTQNCVLEDGIYRLSMRVKTSAGEQNSYAEVKDHGGETLQSEKFATANKWQVYTIDNIKVTKKYCNLGFYTSAPGNSGLQIDDVRLEKKSD